MIDFDAGFFFRATSASEVSRHGPPELGRVALTSDKTKTESSIIGTVPTTMRALVKERPGPGFELKRVPVPKIGPTEVLVRVLMAGICGTDIHILNWDKWSQSRITPPLIVGHEFMGEVAAIGAAVHSVSVGDRVSAESHISCGACLLCRTGQEYICEHVRILCVDRDGAFADYVAVPEHNVWRLDPAVPDAWAAVFDPLGNAVHTVMAAGVSARSVIITGVGSIGLMAIPVARAAGAARVIAVDINPQKLAVAKLLGADAVFDGRDPSLRDKVLDLTAGHGADVLLEMSGSGQAINQGLSMVRNGGRAALLGLPADNVSLNLAENIIFKGLTVLGINGRKMFETWYQMEAMVTTRRVDLSSIITHIVPLERFQEAFDLLKEGKAVKVVMNIASAQQRS
jgi:threonine 3-dehydrogenase